MRLRDGSAFYRRITEQDGQGGYAFPGKSYAGTVSETGNEDPDPGRKNKGIGIPECDAFRPSDSCIA